MITVKEYAAKHNITIQAVYQQINRKKNAEALKGHVEVVKGIKYLDDEAVAILEAARERSPVVVVQENKDERIVELENEIKKLLAENTAAANELKELYKWKSEQAVAIAAAETNKLMLEEKTSLYEQEKIKAEELQHKLTNQEEENRKLREELQNEQKKSWLQKLLGK